MRALFATLLHPVFHARDVLERVAGAVGNLRDVVREAMVFGTDKDGNVTRAVRVELTWPGESIVRSADALERIAKELETSNAHMATFRQGLGR